MLGLRPRYNAPRYNGILDTARPCHIGQKTQGEMEKRKDAERPEIRYNAERCNEVVGW
jgi:hypothetical protein